MNREIKFRGKRLDNGEWVYGMLDCIYKEDGVITISYVDNEGFYCEDKVDYETVGQFTGLLDKNGKEIYEGDIVSREVYWYRDIFDKYTLGFVDTEVILDGFWIGFIIYTNKYGFSIKKVVQIDNHDDTRTKIKGSVKIVQCKTVIIGNIHDNQELLNE